MAPPCCVFVSWITLRKAELMFTLRVEPYYICMELVNGCYSVCWERLLQVLELSIHFFLACFFSHPEFIGFNAIDLIVLRGLFCGGVGVFGGFWFFFIFCWVFFCIHSVNSFLVLGKILSLILPERCIYFYSTVLHKSQKLLKALIIHNFFCYM